MSAIAGTHSLGLPGIVESHEPWLSARPDVVAPRRMRIRCKDMLSPAYIMRTYADEVGFPCGG